MLLAGLPLQNIGPVVALREEYEKVVLLCGFARGPTEQPLCAPSELPDGPISYENTC